MTSPRNVYFLKHGAPEDVILPKNAGYEYISFSAFTLGIRYIKLVFTSAIVAAEFSRLAFMDVMAYF